MARPHKLWYWKSRKTWCVNIGKVRHNLGSDKEAAVAAFHELMLKPKEAPAGTYAQVCDLFLEWCKKHKPASAPWYQNKIQEFIDSLPNKLIKVRELTNDHVLTFVEKGTWGDSYRRGYIVAIVRPLNWALKRGMIGRNPLKGIEKPPQGKRDQYITPEEYKAVLKNATGAFRQLVEMAWSTGARPQELTKVEARHVDLTKGQWVFEVRESKGKKRRRIVYLSEKALQLTKKLMKKHPEGTLLRNSHGEPWNRFAVSHNFTRIEKVLGTRYSLYAFRHSFITNGLIKGVDPITMQHLVGHTSLAMISTIYAHVSQDVSHMRAAAQKATT